MRIILDVQGVSDLREGIKVLKMMMDMGINMRVRMKAICFGGINLIIEYLNKVYTRYHRFSNMC
jgi:hypothetical protein